MSILLLNTFTYTITGKEIIYQGITVYVNVFTNIDITNIATHIPNPRDESSYILTDTEN